MARNLIEALAAELAVAIEAVVGEAVSAPPAPGARGAGWSTIVSLSGGATGSISLWVSETAAATLAKKILGLDDEPDAATVADMLRELWSQAAGAVSLKEDFAGMALAVAMPAAAELSSAAVSFELQLADGVAGHIAGTGDVAAVKEERAPQPQTTALSNPKLELVLDIDLPLIVRFGRTVMTMKALSGLGPGSIVDMGRSPDEPVEMLVSDRVIARGEVVIVGGNYGIRITDLVSPADRVRAMEA